MNAEQFDAEIMRLAKVMIEEMRAAVIKYGDGLKKLEPLAKDVPKHLQLASIDKAQVYLEAEMRKFGEL
jgi:hypothetical protein